ncbi:MAG: hypothetical protein M9949_05985 [Candidatus Kapabacteria bacterium]|nr:hypothetical protein [Candidatus Kapabacteria bacterium]
MKNIILPPEVKLQNLPERILCAAIRNPDEKDLAGQPLIYCGLRHCNILWQSKSVSRKLHHQGFLTSFGRFVDRKEAYQIAKKNNQIIDEYRVVNDMLFSECLY